MDDTIVNVTFLIGVVVGIGACRWLWINGQKQKRKQRKMDDDD